MKALTGPSMYPGTTFKFSCRFLLCVLFLSYVDGNTYQQDAQRAWKNISQLLISANPYEENEHALLSSRNDSTKGSSLLDENNIMHREIFQNNNEDVTYSEEYDEQEAHPPSELKTMLRQTGLSKNSSVSDRVGESHLISNPTNDSREVYGDETYIDQYDTYYYYEDDENATIPDDHYADKSDNNSVSDKNPETSGDLYNYSDSDNSTYHSTHYDNFSDSELYDTDDGTSMESSNKHYVLTSNSSNKLPEKSILIGEAVVSVVTTKSVVNGTISIPVTPLPLTTEQISSPPSASEFVDDKQIERHQTTENSIVLASVQTSRSISGARFLPFPVVEQVVQVAPNVKSNTKVSGAAESPESIIDKLDRVQSELSVQTSRSISGARFPPFPVVEPVVQLAPNVKSNTKVSGAAESTESIIDKLDRVQSELSSGFLIGGFRNSGNTLQLDVLPGTEQNRKSRTTTMRTPIINKFVPHRHNASRKPLTPTRQSPVPTISRFNRNETRLNSSFGSTSKSIGNKSPSLRPPVDKTSSGGARENGSKLKNVVVQDISAFLPPGYNFEKAKSETTEKSLIDDIFAKAKVDVSAFLPPDYVAKQNATSDQKKNDKTPVEDIFKKSQVDLSALLPPGYKPKPENEEAGNTSSKLPRVDDLFAVSKIDISALLPPGYNPKKVDESDESNGKNDTQKKVTTQENTTTEAPVSTTKAGGLKIVFPSRPGGRKPIHRITTPSSAQGHALGAFKPAIHKGWPTRATTEFTGWPTSSTTPISIEKLIEAARTATAQSDHGASTPISSMTSSTTTTTTTTTTPRPTTPGICEEECEVAGTIRLVGNTAWVPELLDSNTVEWKELAREVENEIDSAFAKSATLKKWYKKIKIDAFSKGSILVDYFVELNEIGKKINTQELKSIFHDSLNTYAAGNDNSTEFDNLLVLGEFTIDPLSTDFVVVPKSAVPQQIDDGNTIMPQWAIAVIVIGVGGLLFIIVFGVSVLINRHNVSKAKPTMPMFDEEIEKNIIHKTQTTPRRRSLDYPKQDLYNIDADWNDKSFDSTSNKMMVDVPYHDSSRYNLYDSWRSEWNGYYQNASRSSNRSPGYESTSHVSHRHHPDYDTNF